MTSYLRIPIDTDAAAIEQDVYDALADYFPGWVPAPGNLETFLVKALSQMAADLGEVAADVPAAIFAQFGEKIVNVPPFVAEPATATSTWTMVDNAGYTIPAGTLVGIPAAGDELVAFQVVASVTVPPGSTTTAAGGVVLSAVIQGEAANGLSSTPTLIDALAFVDAIALVGSTSGGQDAEPPEAYLDRLAAEMTLLTPRPILPHDVEVLARRIEEVFRAVALDGYNPADDTDDNERMVAVAVVDEEGEAVSGGSKTELDTLLESMREVTFVFNVIDATYTEIDVAITGTALPGFDTDAVEASAIAAVTDYLSPANWGVASTDSTRTTWRNILTVRYTELVALVNGVEGFDYGNVQLALGGGSLGITNVTLDGPAALSRPGNITATISAP